MGKGSNDVNEYTQPVSRIPSNPSRLTFELVNCRTS